MYDKKLMEEFRPKWGRSQPISFSEGLAKAVVKWASEAKSVLPTGKRRQTKERSKGDRSEFKRGEMTRKSGVTPDTWSFAGKGSFNAA